jgi:hypothetical protein
MSQLDPQFDHLLRRAGFGASPADVEIFRDMSIGEAVAHLVAYEARPDDVDSRIGRPDHAQVATRDLFSPDTDIDDARQRWLFRMIHTRRPLQEKMALFWHNHFATAYSKLAGDSGAMQAAKMLAHKPGPLRGPQGQIELFRQYALGNYRDLLLQVARDPAMVVWLDGQTNTKTKPQENFGREVMELFTVGVGNYTETDVYAAARVFTGWNLRVQPQRRERVPGIRVQRGSTRHRRQDVLVPDLQRWKPNHSSAQRVCGHAGRRGPLDRPGAALGDWPAAGSKVLALLHQRDSFA